MLIKLKYTQTYNYKFIKLIKHKLIIYLYSNQTILLAVMNKGLLCNILFKISVKIVTPVTGIDTILHSGKLKLI